MSGGQPHFNKVSKDSELLFVSKLYRSYANGLNIFTRPDSEIEPIT